MQLDIVQSEDSIMGVVERLTQFARLLRDNGFSIATNATQDAIQVLAEQGGVPSQTSLRNVLALIVCKRGHELARFDELFDAYWLARISKKRTVLSEVQALAASVIEKNQSSKTQSGSGGLATYFEWRDQASGSEDGEEATLPTKSKGASGQESRRHQDFGKVTDQDEARALLQLAESIGAKLRYRLSRRLKVSARGAQIDLRGTLRQAIRTHGLPLKLRKKSRRTPPTQLVVFVDISGSMDSYSLFFTRFMSALSRGLPGTQAFLFHTRLTPVSDVFRDAKPDVLSDKLSLMGQGWSGGTRLGDALASFNKNYASKLRRSRSIALLMSDGYDAGEAGTLADQLTRLKKKCGKLIWLNPLLGRASYTPETKAAQLLLAHADAVAPAHNLASLERLDGVWGRV